MVLRLIILLSLLLPAGANAQLNLESKQMSGLVGYGQQKTGISFTSVILCANPLQKVDDEMALSKNQTMFPGNSSDSKSILFSKTSEIPSYQPRHYGVFCRIESKIEKKSMISPRFRLGSSAYVDMLEGKGN